MYASVMLVKPENLNADDIESRSQQQSERLKSLKGFVAAVTYTDEEKGELGMTTVWETKEDYEAFRNAEAPETKSAITNQGSRNLYTVRNFVTKD